jgi:hypothetical protein
MATPRTTRRSTSVFTIVLRVIAHVAIAWGTLAFLAAGAFLGAAALLLGVAVSAMLPLMAYPRWRGWPFYPGDRAERRGETAAARVHPARAA